MMSFVRRGVNRILKRFGAQVFTLSDMQKEFQKALRAQGRRSPSYAGRTETPDRIVETSWNYVSLVRLADVHPVMRKISQAIIRKCIQNGGGIQPNFAVKCALCHHEYLEPVEYCEECGASSDDLREPDSEQYKRLEQFIANPNRDDEWIDIITSLLRFLVSVDDYYIHLSTTTSQIPIGDTTLDSPVFQIYVEDSRYIRVCADERSGVMGKHEYFCPRCYDGENDSPYYGQEYFIKHGGVCRGPNGRSGCGGALEDTFYVWQESDHSQIKARFARDEILHGRMNAQLPHLYGCSPLIAGIRTAHILSHMDRFQLEHYAEGHTGKLIVFSGVTQDDANQMAVDVAGQIARVDKSLMTGQRAAPKIHTPYIGLDRPEATVSAIEAMPDPEKMQDLEWYQQHMENLCALYGVTPKFEGIAEAGQAGLRMEVDVDSDVARLYQKALEDPFREALWPRIGVTDWSWMFNPIEERDRLLDSRITNMNVSTVIQAVNAGMDAKMMEDGTIEVSGTPEKQEFPMGGHQTVLPYTNEETNLTSPEQSALEGKEEEWIVRRRTRGAAG